MGGTRIGLREVRELAPGETMWHAAVPGFAARRQKGKAVTTRRKASKRPSTLATDT